MGRATIEPELQARVDKAGFLQRWRFKRALNAYLDVCEAIEALFDNYDCGAGMINILTGGRLKRLEDQKVDVMHRLKTIIEALPEA